MIKYFLKQLKEIALNLTAGKLKFQHYWEVLGNISLIARNIGGGGGKQESTGEQILLEDIFQSNKKDFVVFDVGANVGNYSKQVFDIANRENKNVKIYCFEPSMSLKSEINAKLTGQDFELFSCALGNKNGTVTMYTDSPGSDLASIYNLEISYREFNDENKFDVEMKRLDDIIEELSIDTIDLLKIDAEGADLNVLEGASKALSNLVINHIQFEFGPPNITSRIFFRDFWNLLQEEYRIYRIVLDGQYPIHCYSVALENFQTTNYVAKRKDLISHQDILRR